MSEEKLAAARMSDAMGKLQDALSRLKLAAEELTRPNVPPRML